MGDDQQQQVDVDGLAARVLAAIGKHRPAGDEDEDEYDRRPRAVPYDRLRREIDRRRQLEKALADLGKDVEALQQARAAELKKFREDTAAEVKRIGQQHAEDLALVDAGLTDAMGRQVARAAWEAAPKDQRGKSVAEYWSGLVAAHKAHLADPDKAQAPEVPRPLTPYLPQAEEGGEGAGKGRAGASGPPAGPQPRQVKGIDAIPNGQGMDAFIAGLRSLGT